MRALIFFLLCGGVGAQPAPWWREGPLRIVDLIRSLGRIDEMPAGRLAEWKAGQYYNAEHLEVMTMHGGLDDQGFFFRSKAAGKINRDFLREYVAEAHKRGIRVLIYFNVHWYTTAFGEQHADWRQITESGKPLSGVYCNGTELSLAAVVLPGAAGSLRLRCGRHFLRRSGFPG
jgi:hypothetical protein